MNKKSILALLSIGLVLVGCKGTNKPEPEPKPDTNPLKADEVEVKVSPNLNDNADPYKLRFHFGKELFDQESTTYNQDLALLSLGASLAETDSKSSSAFYQRIGLSDALIHSLPEPTEDTIGYSFAFKRYEDYDLIAMNFRGFNYGMEWANNLDMGETGNHNGFEARAQEAFTQLLFECHATQPEPERVKVWLTGYSRGGALANMVAQKMLSMENSPVEPEDLFVYTFEAPQGLTEANAVSYPNVFNIVNSADIVTYVAPQQYGLYRCGNDVQIYQSENDLNRLIHELDKDITLPSFSAQGSITTEQQFINYVFETIMGEDKNAGAFARTRAEFVANYQEGLKYFIGLYFSLDGSTRNKISSRLQALDGAGMMAIMADDGLYNFLKPILDEDNVQYNDDDLHESCTVMTKFMTNNFAVVYSMFTSNNLTRIISMHAPEVTYVLLKDLKVY